MSAKFWMVYNVSKSLPTIAHPTKESADTEAMRLAEKHPGNRVVVLESVYEYTTAPQPVVKVDHKVTPGYVVQELQP